MTIAKQQTGFKFGKYRLEVIRQFGEVKHNGRTYKLLGVKTHEGQDYLSLRLYNATGKFIKQLLIEPRSGNPNGPPIQESASAGSNNW